MTSFSQPKVVQHERWQCSFHSDMSNQDSPSENSDNTDSEDSSSIDEVFDDDNSQIDAGFMPYDPSVEPVATEEQANLFAQERLEEEEEEKEYRARLSGEKDVRSW